MELSIIIPTIGDLSILDRTLGALIIATDGIEVEIILVDDSTQGTVKAVENKIKVIRTGGRGASHARNAGLKIATADLLLFLDDDILIERSHILKTIELHRNSENTAFNFYWEYPPDLMAILHQSKFGNYILRNGLYSNQHRLNGDFDDLAIESLPEGLTSQYFSIEKKYMSLVGGYDPIPFAGAEDVLLYRKLKKIGVEVFLRKDQIVFQNESNRIRVEKLLSRYRTGNLTRRIAFLRGHKDLGLNFNKGERVKGTILVASLPILRLLERILPFGFLYRKTIHAMLYAGSFLGFYKDKLPSPYSEEFDQKLRK